MACKFTIYDKNGNPVVSVPSMKVLEAWLSIPENYKLVYDNIERGDLKIEYTEIEEPKQPPYRSFITGNPVYNTEGKVSFNKWMQRYLESNKDRFKDSPIAYENLKSGVYSAVKVDLLLDAMKSFVADALAQNKPLSDILKDIVVSDLSSYQKAAIYGAINNIAAETGNLEVEVDAQKQLQLISNEAGTLLVVLREMLKNTPEGLAAFYAAEINKSYFNEYSANPLRYEEVKQAIIDAVKSAETVDVSDTMQEAFERGFEEGSKEELKKLEAERKELEAAKRKVRSKGGKSNPVVVYKNVTTKEVDDAYKRLRGKVFSLLSGLDPEVVSDLMTISRGALAKGITNVSDFVDYLTKNTGRKSPIFTELYNNVKEEAISLGAEEGVFNTESEIEAFNVQYEKALTEAIEKAKAKAKEKELKNINKQIKDALIQAGFSKTINIKGEQKEIVDWKSVMLSSESETKEAVINKVKETLEDAGFAKENIESFLEDISNTFDTIVAEKKIKAIERALKEKGTKKQTIKPSEAVKLSELLKLGNIETDVNLQRAVLNTLGLDRLTPEDYIKLKELTDEVNNAPVGREKVAALKRLETFVNVVSNMKATNTINYLNELSIGNMLSQMFTQYVNATDGLFNLLAKGLLSYIQSGFDKNVFKAAFADFNKSLSIAADIFYNGGAESTQGFLNVETGGKVGGGVNITENLHLPEFYIRLLDKDYNINKATQSVLKAHKWVFRTMGAVDSFVSINMAALRKYEKHKQLLKNADKSISKSKLRKESFDAVFFADKEMATRQATEEFAKRGIFENGVPKTKAEKIRFNARVSEIMMQQSQKDEKAFLASESGQIFSGITTYKLNKIGSFTLAASLFNGLFNVIEKKTTKTRQGRLANSAMNSVRNMAIPFLTSISRITEQQAEVFPPYGLVKYGILKGTLLGLKEETAKDVERYKQIQEDVANTELNIFKGVMISLALFSFAYIRYLIDSDDDEEKAKKEFDSFINLEWLTGTMQNTSDVERTFNVPRSIDNTIPISALPSVTLSLGVLAELADKARETRSPEDTWRDMVFDFDVLSSALFYSTIEQNYARGTKEFAELFTSTSEKTQNKRNKFLSNAISTRIPMTGFSRQLEELRKIATKDVDAKYAVSLADNLAKSVGIVGDWLNEKPMVDFRGRKMSYIESYKQGLGGAVNAFTKGTLELIKPDKYDEWLRDINASIKIPKRSQGSDPSKYEEAMIVSFVNYENGREFMDADDYYTFITKIGRKFNDELTKSKGLYDIYSKTSPETAKRVVESKYKNIVKQALFETNMEYLKREGIKFSDILNDFQKGLGNGFESKSKTTQQFIYEKFRKDELKKYSGVDEVGKPLTEEEL